MARKGFEQQEDAPVVRPMPGGAPMDAVSRLIDAPEAVDQGIQAHMTDAMGRPTELTFGPESGKPIAALRKPQPVVKSKRYEVQSRKAGATSVSFIDPNSGGVSLEVGRIIDERHYDMRAIRNQKNIVLVEVDEDGNPVVEAEAEATA